MNLIRAAPFRARAVIPVRMLPLSGTTNHTRPHARLDRSRPRQRNPNMTDFAYTVDADGVATIT